MEKTPGRFSFTEMAERKAFNFYRSYFDTAKELPAEDRESFLMALLEKQFNNIEPDLSKMTPICRMAYIGQKHSVDSQVEGFYNNGKRKEPFIPPSVGATKPPSEAPSVQEKGEDKEELSNTKGNHFFKHSPLFDKSVFKEKFSGWPAVKMKHYYESAIDYSDSKGKMYKDWAAAIRSWARKDERNGVKFSVDSNAGNIKAASRGLI